jgi:glycosyltransferase involved in cell wall biosynthesis
VIRLFYWVDHTCVFPGNSGIQRVARGLAVALQELGCDLQFVRWNADQHALEALDEDQFRHLAKWNGPSLASPPLPIGRQDKLSGWLLIPEVVSYAGAPSLEFVIGHAHASGLRVAVVFFDANPHKQREHYTAAEASTHACYMAALASADAVFAISNTARDDLLSFLYQRCERTTALDEKVVTVQLPGELLRVERVRSYEDRRAPHGGKVVLCVSSIEPRKNHLRLIDAFLAARARLRNDMRLIMIGASQFPELASRVREAAARSGCITWIEGADEETLARWYRECDFTVYPSPEEGFGLAIMESLWHGKPCVCHHASAMAELAAGGGCLTANMLEPEDMEQAIVRLASDGETFRRLCSEASSRPIKRWTQYGSEILFGMEKLAGEAPVSEVSATTGNQSRIIRHSPPLLSLCISTYNRAHWLAWSLSTALRLTKPFADVVEVLVVDNASTDHTAEIARQHQAAPQLRYERNATNVGMLGNLKVTARHARGEYLWIIGDDDIIMPTAVERVLWAIATLHDIPLIYLNYAYTRLENAAAIKDISAIYDSAIPISAQTHDEIAEHVRTIATRTENCFTAIYSCVFRRDHGVAAYSIDTSGVPFSSLSTSVPSALHVLDHLFHGPGLWLGQPSVAVNMNVSWGRYAPLFVLERLPEIYDLMEARGADKEELDAIREHNVPGVLHFLDLLFTGGADDVASGVSFERVVRRFKHIPAFRVRLPKLLKQYEAARRARRLPAEFPSASTISKRYGLHSRIGAA